jgi:hypothetical protein
MSDKTPRKRRQEGSDRAVYAAAAEKCARYVFENDFPRRACFPVEVGGRTLLIVFDDYPFKAGAWVREKLLCRARRRFDQLGLVELASAAWPPKGQPNAGHTVVMAVAPWSEELEDAVIVAYEEELERTYAELFDD